MNRLTYPKKFLLISALFILPLVIVVSLLFSEIHDRLDFAQKELYGTDYLRPLIKFSQTIYQSQTKASNLTGLPLASEIEMDWDKLKAVQQKYSQILDTNTVFPALENAKNQLVQNYQQSASYDKVISVINHLRARVGDTSNLILDPDLDSYYLMDAILIKLPAQRLTIHNLQMQIKAVRQAGNLTPDTAKNIIALSKLLQETQGDFDFNLNTGFSNNPKGNLRSKLTPISEKFSQEVNQIHQVFSEITANTPISALNADILSQALDTSWQMWQSTADSLDELLIDRRWKFQIRKYGIGAFITVILLVVIYVLIGFYRSVMNTVSSLEEAAQRMARGETNAKKLALETQDELSRVAYSFNQIANAVIRAEAKFRSIFENSIDGIFQTTVDGTYLSVNPALARICGYDSPETMMASFSDIATQLYVNPDRRNEFKSLIAEQGKVSDFESQVYRKDGSIIWISENARAVRDEQGNILYYEGAVEDINQRKQSETDLALANEQIKALNAQLSEENTRMRSELAIARKLQQMILPKETELKKIQDLEVAGFMQPADEVGGDYYDVLQEGGRIKIGIGDVTGHGLESGMVMLMVQMAVRTLLTSQENDPIKFLYAINQAVYRNVQRMDTDRNLTLTLLDYEKGRVTLSGQHEEIILVRANGSLETINTINLGFPIGLEENIENFLDKMILHLNTDDVVVLYTDGITEAENSNKEMYGLQRLCDQIVSNRHKSAVEIRNAIVEDVIKFIDNNHIYDDITLLVLKQK